MRSRRAYTLISIAAACIFFLLVGAGLYSQVQDVKAERKGCERLDAVRSTVYVVLTTAADAQRDDAQLTDKPHQRAQQLAAAMQFTEQANRLINSITPHSALIEVGDREPVDGLPDEIHVDCEIAYPYPFGL